MFENKLCRWKLYKFSESIKRIFVWNIARIKISVEMSVARLLQVINWNRREFIVTNKLLEILDKQLEYSEILFKNS